MADRRLAVWTLASFHAAGLALGFVVPAYASGGLSDVLPEFGTVSGFLGYGYLWALSYLGTRWALTDDVLADVLDGSLRPVLLRGSTAGGLVGLGTFLGPLALLAVPGLLAGSGTLQSVVVIAAIGSGIAVTIGVVVGFVFSLLDVAALHVASGLVRTDDGRRNAD